MIGKRYWSTGITLRYRGDQGPQWLGVVDFYDEGFGADDIESASIGTEGELSTRYYVSGSSHQQSLQAVTDTLRTDAERLGIEFRDPALLVEGDGEDPGMPLPEGWRDLLREQADRLGWDTYGLPEEA